MPAPNADWIAAMLNPYKGFSTADSAKMGIAAGQGMAGARHGFAELQQRGELARADDQRARDYMGFQREQWQTGRSDKQKADQFKAFDDFQAAINDGDVEGAELAANKLRAMGVDVQSYGGQEEKPNTSPGPMGAMTRGSPTAMVDNARAQPKSADPEPVDYNPEADAEDETNDALIKQWETEPASDPEEEAARQEFIFQANEAKQRRTDAEGEAQFKQNETEMQMQDRPGLESRIRPGPQRVGGLPASSPVEQSGEESAAAAGVGETGPRPAPARDTKVRPEEGPGSATAQAQGIRGYRLSLDGQVIDIDPQSVLERQQNRVARVMGPIVQNATDEREQAAAQGAYEAAIQAVEIYGPEKATQIGLEWYNSALNRESRTRNTRINSGKAAGDGYGGVPGNTKDSNAVAGQLRDDFLAHINSIASKNDVPGIRKMINAGEKVDGLLSSGTGLGQRAALTSTLKQWFGAASSNKELDFVKGAEGKLSQLEAEFNAYANGGKLPDDFVDRLRDVTRIINEGGKRKLHEVGSMAAKSILGDFTFTDRMTPEQAKNMAANAYGLFTGEFPEQKEDAEQEGRRGAAPARGGKAKGKPAAGGKKKTRAQQEAEDVLK